MYPVNPFPLNPTITLTHYTTDSKDPVEKETIVLSEAEVHNPIREAEIDVFILFSLFSFILLTQPSLL